jgi:uncharacterized membrane protein
MKGGIVLFTTAAVILLDPAWSLVAATASGLVLFAAYRHAEHHRHSPYRQGWY